jgi:hypothetical protein
VNWYVNRFFKIQANFIREKLDDPSQGRCRRRRRFIESRAFPVFILRTAMRSASRRFRVSRSLLGGRAGRGTDRGRALRPDERPGDPAVGELARPRALRAHTS